MKRFFKKLVGFSIGSILGAVFSSIMVPISTHFLLPNEYGKTSMFNFLYSILVLLTLLGFDQAFIREYYEHEDKKKLFANAMLIPMICVLVIIPTMVFFAPDISYFLFESKEYVIVVYMLDAVLPLLILERFILVDIRMQEKAFLYSVYSLLLKIIAFIVNLIFLFCVRRDFLAIVYSTLISHYIGDILLIVIYHKNLYFERKILDINLVSIMMKYALPLLPAAIIGMIFNCEDKLFIKVFSDYTQLGYYQTAMTITNIISILQSAFTTFWTPTVLRWRSEQVSNVKYEIVQKGVAFVASILFIGILLCRNLFPFILSQRYESTKYVMPFLLLYPVMTIMISTTISGIDFAKKTEYTLYFSILVTILNFVLNWLLVPKWGSMGAAVATGISHLFYFWVRTLYSRKLWFDFELKHLVVVSVVLFASAVINSCSFIKDEIVYLVDVVAVIVILVLYKAFTRKLSDIFLKRVLYRKNDNGIY